MTYGTLIIPREDVVRVLRMPDCIEAVERAFVRHARKETIPPGVLGAHVEGGGFHVKSAGLLDAVGGRPVFAAKVNANFPGNPDRHGLPTIQGVIALFDAADGRLLALLDSIEITSLRTAAATAVAAKYLAPEARHRHDLRLRRAGQEPASRADLCPPREARHGARPERGAGDALRRRHGGRAGRERQRYRRAGRGGARDEHLGDVHARASVAAWAGRTSRRVPSSPRSAPTTPRSRRSSRSYSPRAPSSLTSSSSARRIGDLHHAIAAGLMRREDVRAELADVVSGRKPGRLSPDEIVVFDSTGTALQDVAAAALVYERARSSGAGLTVSLGAA